MSRGELREEFVTEDPGAVAVAEIKTQRVISHALEAENPHCGKILLGTAAILIAENILFTTRLGTGRGRPQLGSAEVRLRTVVPNDGDFRADELDVLWRFQSEEGAVWKELAPLVMPGKQRQRGSTFPAAEDERGFEVRAVSRIEAGWKSIPAGILPIIPGEGRSRVAESNVSLLALRARAREIVGFLSGS
jgi:hypothetical protein